MRETPVVVALGGNAIAPPGRMASLSAQYELTRATAEHLVHLSERPLLVTHGNGPQVGDALLRSDRSADVLPRLPLDACVAGTQGDMGYMLGLCLDDAFQAAGVRRRAVALVTRTVVDFDDPAFQHPSKPIGRAYGEVEARAHMAADGWVMQEESGRGWRRVVPSPEPREIVEERAIRVLLATGAVVVAVGGGGVPVVRQADGSLVGVEAVVDKDLASALVAADIGAEVLMILTGVEHVAIDFDRPTQRDLQEVGTVELAAYARQGQFAPGSMLPKVRAVLRFLERGGRRAVITTPELSEKALAGEAGTQIVP
ncbi:MAG TPA: carbamate kinase [Actinomycetota bacterium]|nr:carbamate kinase [Actinomycetota bacterium]